jgi:hypothetical protein
MGDRHIENVVFFVVEKRESVEPYHSVGYSTLTKAMTDGFGDANYDLSSIQQSLDIQVRMYRPTIVGRIYVNAPVSSNIITVTETAKCIMPLRAAPAPRKAYVPGVIHGTSGSQAEKKLELG